MDNKNNMEKEKHIIDANGKAIIKSKESGLPFNKT